MIYLQAAESSHGPYTATANATTEMDSSGRQCANCGTFKSAGKWRRDRENYANYLCNKCGMNQRRACLKYVIDLNLIPVMVTQ
jgi:predicted RNA-binding Zn-ribbon protein involved in translation (DUF1610 family)